MQGVRFHLLAGVGCACFASACSLLTNFDGFGGAADERDAAPGDPEAGGDVHVAPSDAALPDGADGPFCTNDLSNIGTANFTISLTLTTTQVGTVAVANQRQYCNGSDFWDVHLQDGDVQAETDDGVMYHTSLNTAGPAVNDGKPHSISIQRRNEVLTVYVDGVAAGSAMSASAFGQLITPVNWGTSPCVGHTNYYSLVMPITDLTNRCVSGP
jgi:hypothetical protein